MADWMKWPEEDLDFAFDFTARLETGETIVSQEVTAATGLTAHNVSQAQGVVTVWLDGGAGGQYYTVECVIVTSADREMKAEVVIYVR